MAGPISVPSWSAIARLCVLLLIALGLLLGWHYYRRDYTVTQQSDGRVVTQVIAARLGSANAIKVSELSGTIQSTATDVRGFGLLKSDQVVKMPFSVDYFVDARAIRPTDLEWVEASHTLIIKAPDVTVGKPNVDESRRTLVQTNGMFVTRQASEELSRRTSAAAQSRAQAEARSPERMAQARENARRSLAQLLGAPLAKVGYGDARVVVTFPLERSATNREEWDVTKPIPDVLATHE